MTPIEINCSHAGIFFSKDRQETVIEVEEDPETIILSGYTTPLRILTQGQWMKGCPEAGEQNFLFSQYHELTGGECLCPHGCGTKVARQKRDFFAVFVSIML